MIPLVVGRDGLLAANSLFTLTVIATQVAALVAFVPLAVKTIGIIYTFILLALFYAGATILLMLLPRDAVPLRRGFNARSMSARAWREIGEGWEFTLKHRPILIAILQFSLVGVLVFVMGTLAPGYAARVLDLSAEDSIFVFSPAGAGLLIASLFVVRAGPHFARYTLPITGMILMSLALLALGVVGRYSTGAMLHLDFFQNSLLLNSRILIGIASIFAGIALAFILIPAQTAVQEEAPDEIRGRVLTVQFTLANAIGVLPLLTIGGLADLIGIPTVTLLLGLVLLLIAAVNFNYARDLAREEVRRRPVAQALPIPGTDASTVRVNDDSVDHLTPREQGT